MSTLNKKVSSLVNDIAATVRAKVGPEASQPAFAATFFGVSLLCLAVPLELSQLTFALIGALTYALLQSLQVRTTRREEKSSTKVISPRKGDSVSYRSGYQRGFGDQSGNASRSAARRAPAAVRGDSRGNSLAMPAARIEVRKPSSQPISAPVFQGQGFNAEVDELLGQVMPTPQGESIVKAVADFVEDRIRPLIPEVEVMGFATGDLVRGTAFGVAVPEVDIVVNVSPDILAQRLQGRFSKGSVSTMRLDVRKLQKSAIRACTDRLVSAGGFKFRRSAFRGEEPKVTLLVPASFGVSEESIPIDFTVNSTTPFYNMALITQCGKKDIRARALILLVKRWAKDRGVCHAAKGHLSPYPWSLLVIFFLQAAEAAEGGGSLLPPVEDLEVSSKMLGAGDRLPQDSKKKSPSAPSKMPRSPPDFEGPPKTVAELFKEFINFYHRVFDWRKEVISVRTGKRGPPGLALPLHIIVNEDTQATEVGPSIEDPFNPSRNLGVVMTSVSLARLHKEIARADELCANGSSLSKLLEPWAPPEHGSHPDSEDDDSGDKEDRDADSTKPKHGVAPGHEPLKPIGKIVPQPVGAHLHDPGVGA
jgi:hypothetical protein